MSSRPFYPFFYNDFRTDTLTLTAEEAGVYQELINIAWERGDGTIPDDLNWLKAKLRCRFADFHGHTFNRIVPKLLRNYFVHIHNAYRQPRAAKICAKVAQKSAKNRQNVRKRWSSSRNINDLEDTLVIRNLYDRNTNHNQIEDSFLTSSETAPREASKEAVGEKESKQAVVQAEPSLTASPELAAIIQRKWGPRRY